MRILGFCILFVSLSVFAAEVESENNIGSIFAREKTYEDASTTVDLFAGPSKPANRLSMDFAHPRFNWATGRDGWGYCYEWGPEGQVMNGGRPVSNGLCEMEFPSHFDWGTGRNGFGYCYQFTPYYVAMNAGAAMAIVGCERVIPSRTGWGRGQNGYTYCYRWTPYGQLMNEGRPIDRNECR